MIQGGQGRDAHQVERDARILNWCAVIWLVVTVGVLAGIGVMVLR